MPLKCSWASLLPSRYHTVVWTKDLSENDLTLSAGECSVTGDMYFQSFDGRIFTFPATCQYVLAKSRSSGKFTVTIQNAPCGAVSYVQSAFSVFIFCFFKFLPVELWFILLKQTSRHPSHTSPTLSSAVKLFCCLGLQVYAICLSCRSYHNLNAQ